MTALNEAVTDKVIDDDVEITTSVDENPDDGEIIVSRTAAFAELADEPRHKTIDAEMIEGDIKFFDQLRDFDPELAGTLLAQSMATTSGMDAVHPASLDFRGEQPTELEKTITEDSRKLLRDLNLKKDGPAIVRDLVTHGNDVSHISYDEGEGITALQTLPLRALTILDFDTFRNAGHSQHTHFSHDFSEDMRRVITSNDVYVINEANSEAQEAYPEHDILHIALDRHRNWYTDRKGRETFEVWGSRRLDPVKYTVQVKQNTLANKVAMDDKLLAREFYLVNVEELFGHIEDDKRRHQKAKDYAAELRKIVENLKPDQKPILPQEVEIKIEGPDGETARNLSNFIQTMNDSIQHALTYHVASFGRDAGGTDRGNKPAKDMSDNSVRQLRDLLKTSFQRLFEYHAVLRHPEAREEVDAGVNDIRRYRLREDVTLPVLTFDPVDPQEQSEKVRDAISLYEKGIGDLNEARAIVGLDPITDEEIQNRPFFKIPGQEMEIQEMQNQGDEGTDDDPDVGDGPGDGPGGNRRSRPTDSEAADEDEDDE